MTAMQEVLKMLALGLLAGVLSGLFGIGGGLVIVPALVLIFGFQAKTAVGTSLFVILLPTGLLGVLNYWKAGELRLGAGLWIALGVFCGAYFGSYVGVAISEGAMKRLYGVFLLAVAVYFLASPQSGTAPQGDLTPHERRGEQSHPGASGSGQSPSA
jgi:uncharacterized membrane protein YfcA